MRNFTLRKGFLGSKCGTRSSFKGFVMLIVMMLMTASSAMAQDVKFEVIDGLRYLLDTGAKTAALMPKTDGNYSGDIVVSEKVKDNEGVDYRVVAFGDNCFLTCGELTSITIPSSVTSLGESCFRGCTGLTSITIPSSVTSLGSGCFSDCTSLTSIFIPTSITSLSSGCFNNCTSLTSVTIPSSVMTLDGGCFFGCTSLASITIPSSVTTLGEYCFAACESLSSIIIPSTVTTLGFRCFEWCCNLTSVTIPPSITSLDDSCFSGCTGLTSLIIPSSVTSLGDKCFDGCCALTSVSIPSSVTSLGLGCFHDCTALTSISIPSSVKSLGLGCFDSCSSLTSITIPSSVVSLGGDCFSHCSNLELVYFKGKPTNSSYPSLDLQTNCIIKVPAEYLQDYKNAFGTKYKYIYAWNPSESGDDTKPVTPCATPSISYASGELKFASETAGAEYHYTITDADMASNAYNKEGKVTLSAAYNISVYATADGYSASDKAEATLYWINANLDNGTNINQVRTRGVVASAHDGIISLSGLDDGEVVKFFAADGKYLGSTVAANCAASYAVSESLVIAKVGKDSIKIAMK